LEVRKLCLDAFGAHDTIVAMWMAILALMVQEV